MFEEGASRESSYGSFISKAFIDPIRSVIVVDDEFPTLEALIDKETGKTEGSKHEWAKKDAERVRESIGFCREGSRKWMVEVNDGRISPEPGLDNSITHLHQSDLLILDYHLDRDAPNDGARAIHILRHLARNDHFNLVVVYTKGPDVAAGTIEQVSREIAVGLSRPNPSLVMNAQALGKANELVESLEDGSPGIAERLKESIDDGAFLVATRLCREKRSKQALEQQELHAFQQMLAALTSDHKEQSQILRWALHHRYQAILSRLFHEGTEDVDYAWDRDGANWIRTERLFITVLGKSTPPADLPKKLAKALETWGPEPHRLLMSRMRAELDETGVLAEAEIIGDRFLQAGWLEEFLTEDPAARTWKIRNTVTRHWESLGDGIQKRVLEFSEGLASHLLTRGRRETLERHAPPEIGAKRDELALHMNRYVCSKPVEGHHLTTGHVLKIAEAGKTTYRLCLSPACDLEPRPRTTGWAGRLNGFVPFMAVELFADNRDTALSNANAGNHLFLSVGDNKIESFSFSPPLTDNESGAKTANPKWEQMFAEHQGRFENFRVNIRRVAANENGDLSITQTEAHVVAQLRYEYALNLLQRLGANLSRVGLDFIQPS